MADSTLCPDDARDTIAAVVAVLGHASPTMSVNYDTASRDDARELASRLGDLWT